MAHVIVPVMMLLAFVRSVQRTVLAMFLQGKDSKQVVEDIGVIGVGG